MQTIFQEMPQFLLEPSNYLERSEENFYNKEDAVDASGVDAAMDALKGLSTDGGETISTNVRAAYAAFEEVELPKLKEENPRLKMSQYKEQLSKMWRKDPRNPANFPKA